MNFYSVFKNVAFKFDPEFIHDMSIYSGSTIPQIAELFSPLKASHRYQLSFGDLSWSFPVGLAAGFDKNALAINFFKKMGFGAIEIGTVTKLPQKGNPKPRIFRHSEIKSLQNSMGFPNQGSERILNNIQNNFQNDFCLGVNIGKNKDTTEEKTPEEYAYLYQMFAPVANYLVVNISSPNTPGLRSFQKKELLAPILSAIQLERNKNPRPVFIKIAPDLEAADLKMICELSKEYKFSGIIATNTTIQHQFGVGGLSGEYIKDISKNIRKQACELLKEDPTQIVIGVGGIDSYREIKEFWKLGGSFTQIYTSLIYHGPSLLAKIATEIDLDLKKYQFSNLQEMLSNITKVD